MSDDDWDTDPDFVNDASEQQQRWGNKGGTMEQRNVYVANAAVQHERQTSPHDCGLAYREDGTI
jgi:hypothetical protein